MVRRGAAAMIAALAGLLASPGSAPAPGATLGPVLRRRLAAPARPRRHRAHGPGPGRDAARDAELGRDRLAHGALRLRLVGVRRGGGGVLPRGDRRPAGRLRRSQVGVAARGLRRTRLLDHPAAHDTRAERLAGLPDHRGAPLRPRRRLLGDPSRRAEAPAAHLADLERGERPGVLQAASRTSTATRTCCAPPQGRSAIRTRARRSCSAACAATPSMAATAGSG